MNDFSVMACIAVLALVCGALFLLWVITAMDDTNDPCPRCRRRRIQLLDGNQRVTKLEIQKRREYRRQTTSEVIGRMR